MCRSKIVNKFHFRGRVLLLFTRSHIPVGLSLPYSHMTASGPEPTKFLNCGVKISSPSQEKSALSSYSRLCDCLIVESVSRTEFCSCCQMFQNDPSSVFILFMHLEFWRVFQTRPLILACQVTQFRLSTVFV